MSSKRVAVPISITQTHISGQRRSLALTHPTQSVTRLWSREEGRATLALSLPLLHTHSHATLATATTRTATVAAVATTAPSLPLATVVPRRPRKVHVYRSSAASIRLVRPEHLWSLPVWRLAYLPKVITPARLGRRRQGFLKRPGVTLRLMVIMFVFRGER